MNVTANIGTAAHAGTARTWASAGLACMGVVFGDIGTSPLYTLCAAARAVSPGRRRVVASCARHRDSFGSSGALAGAYGIAVSLLMAITTLATFIALHWKHNPILGYAVNGSLLGLDLLFVGGIEG
jgi:K+ transporter